MKPAFITVIIFLAIAAFVACNKTENTNNEETPCLPANLNSGVLAFYSFGNGSINDASGNNHHLTNNTGAMPAKDRNGNPDCAYYFDGTQYLKFPNPVFLDNLSSFSISLWYAPADSTRDGSVYEALVCRDTTLRCPNRYGEWSLGLYDCRLAVFGVQNSVWELPVTNTSCEDVAAQHTGSWHHLAATLDAAGNQMKIYRDGILQDTRPLVTSGCTTNLPIQNIGDLFLGKKYKGRLDDVLLYDHALSQQEVTQLSQLPTCCYLAQ